MVLQPQLIVLNLSLPQFYISVSVSSSKPKAVHLTAFTSGDSLVQDSMEIQPCKNGLSLLSISASDFSNETLRTPHSYPHSTSEKATLRYVTRFWTGPLNESCQPQTGRQGRAIMRLFESANSADRRRQKS